MEQTVLITGLAIAVAVLVSRPLALRLHLPPAIPLVVIGVAASYIPDISTELDPEIVLLAFLPILVFHAAVFTSPRETRENAIPIGLLAIGLVVLTTVAVAAACRFTIDGLAWAPALALGAAVAPTDPVAATAVLKRIGAPGRIVTILEGESLVNDGVALTIFALAIEATVGGGFSLGEGALRLVEVVVGGLAFGLAVGWGVGWVRARTSDEGSRILLLLLAPYLAYLPAEHFKMSGVLATVAAGVYLGKQSTGIYGPSSRIVSAAFFGVLTFLAESTLFVLLGLAIPGVVRDVNDDALSVLVVATLMVTLVVVGLRLAFQILVPPLLAPTPNGRLGFLHMSWRPRLVVGWSGMRGAISLAIALSIPLTANGEPFPGRSLLIFLAAVVVLVTLVGQGGTIGWVAEALGVERSRRERREGVLARRVAVETALLHLDEMVGAGRADEAVADALRPPLELRLERLQTLEDDERDNADAVNVRPIQRELLRAQRGAINRLYEEGKIGAPTLRELNRELDFDDPRLRRSATP